MEQTILLHDAVALLKEMVRIPSLSFEEKAVCSHISSKLDSWGIPHVVRRNNVIAVNRFFDPSRKTLAMDAHMDTVPVNNGYTRDPFEPGEDDSIIYGLGSNDDGGSVVSMTAAFRHFYDRQLPFNLMLILSCEEERSGEDGTRWLFGEDGYFANGGEYPMPDWVIVGEPTGLRAASSERGLLVIDGEAHGVSGHAARGEGVNALYIALEDIQTLKNHVFDRHSPIMGDVKLNVTQIHAGTAHNVIPDLCSFVVDIRPTEQYSNTEILEELQAVCSSTLKARNLTNRSSATRQDSPLLKAAQNLGIETFSSPTTSDWMRIGCDAMKIGPGESSRSHKADEFIMTQEIADAIGTYIKIIDTFYGNTLE